MWVDLVLAGITDMYGPFYSAESATGLIMATGTVGTYLQQNKDQVNTCVRSLHAAGSAAQMWFHIVAHVIAATLQLQVPVA